jgi:hypothetical protein
MKSEFYINKSELGKVSELLYNFQATSCRLFYDNSNGISGTLQAIIEHPVIINGIPHEGELSITLTDHNSC